MTSVRAHEALYESEAALRLVDQEISDLRGDVAQRQPSLVDLPMVLLQANTQIVDVLSRVRAERTALQRSASERVQATHDMMSALQIQDILTQQVTHASDVLTDMETRLADVAKLFDASLDEQQPVGRALNEQASDHNATTTNIAGRQALADEIFTAMRLPAA